MSRREDTTLSHLLLRPGTEEQESSRSLRHSDNQWCTEDISKSTHNVASWSSARVISTDRKKVEKETGSVVIHLHTGVPAAGPQDN